MRAVAGSNLSEVLKALRPDELLMLEPGEYLGGASVYNKPRIRIAGEGAVTIRGGDEYGIKFQQCNGLDLANLNVLESGGNGVFIVQCQGATVRAVNSSGHRASGVLTSRSSRLITEKVTAHKNKGHGIYFSESGDRLVASGCGCDDNGKCGIQINATEEKPRRKKAERDGISEYVTLVHNILARNQSEGHGTAINLAGCRNVNLQHNQVLEHMGRYCVSFFDDGQGDEYDCRDVLIRGNTFQFAPEYGEASVQITAGSKNVKIGANDWDEREGLLKVLDETRKR